MSEKKSNDKTKNIDVKNNSEVLNSTRKRLLEQQESVNNWLNSTRKPLLEQQESINNWLNSTRKPLLEQQESINNWLNSTRKPLLEQQESINNWLNSTRKPLLEQQESVNNWLNSTRTSVENVKNNWLLSDSVIKNVSQGNNQEEAIKIFNSIPKEHYEIVQEYDGNNDKLKYILRNTENKNSVPLNDLSSTTAVSDFFTSITTTEIFDFYNFLVKYPMFGIKHHIGKRIFDEIPNIELKRFEKIKMYRARERDSQKNPIPYTELEMFEAPFGLANHGRFNVVGQGELYTSSNKEVALKEIAKNAEHLCYDIIEWELQKSVHLLEISSFDTTIGKYISIEKDSNTNAYLVPNFLSQCIKYHGITGISYISVLDDNETNYVFFDFENNWFKPVGRESDLKFQ